MPFLRHVSLVLAILLALSLGSCTVQDETTDQLLVVTSFYPVYDFSKKLAGEHATVVVMTPPGIDPHDWEPSPSDITVLQQADIFVYNGADMEHWVDAALATVDPTKTCVVEAAAGLTRSHDTDNDHKHRDDPHVWLDPMLAKQQMAAILDALVIVDPQNEANYRANFDTYAQKLDALNETYRQTLEPYQGQTIVVSHEAFGYMCAAYGLHQMGIQGLSSDTEPDAAKMRDIIDFINAHHIKVVFSDALIDPKVAEVIADETGARLMSLETIGGGVREDDDYFSLMEANLATLVAAFSSSDNTETEA